MISTRELQEIVDHINHKFESLFKSVAEIENKIESLNSKEKGVSKNGNKNTIKG